MALTRSDIPNLLLPGLKTEFELAYRSQMENSIAEQLATTINTTLPIQKYAWIGSTPPMRELIDERRPGGMAAYTMQIEDKVFESSVAVDRKAVEDDQLDLIRLRIKDLAFRIAQHRHQLIVDTLMAGFATNTYDGVPFFAANHPGYLGTVLSNKTTSALSEASLAEGISTMMGVADDAGAPLGVVPDTLVVGPKLMWLATELLESPVVVYKGNPDDTAPSTPYVNALHGKLKLVVSPFIQGNSDDFWFLLDTKRPIRSVILQQRSDVPVEFSALESTTGSEAAWMRDRYYYGVRARYNAGFGLWQTAYGAQVS